MHRPLAVASLCCALGCAQRSPGRTSTGTPSPPPLPAGAPALSTGPATPGHAAPIPYDFTKPWVAFFLGDAPAPGVQSVRVHVSRLDLHYRSGAWFSVALDDTVNLLDLQGGVYARLLNKIVPEGVLTELRLVGNGVDVTANGVTEPLDVPSDPQTGIKIPSSAPISHAELTVVTLDWPASLHRDGKTGRWTLDPVIKSQYATYALTVADLEPLLFGPSSSVATLAAELLLPLLPQLPPVARHEVAYLVRRHSDAAQLAQATNALAIWPQLDFFTRASLCLTVGSLAAGSSDANAVSAATQTLGASMKSDPAWAVKIAATRALALDGSAAAGVARDFAQNPKTYLPATFPQQQATINDPATGQATLAVPGEEIAASFAFALQGLRLVVAALGPDALVDPPPAAVAAHAMRQRMTAQEALSQMTALAAKKIGGAP